MILWDLDGTVIDSLEDLGAAVDYTLKVRGLPTHGREAYRRMVGHGVRNLVKQALAVSTHWPSDGATAPMRNFPAIPSSTASKNCGASYGRTVNDFYEYKKREFIVNLSY